MIHTIEFIPWLIFFPSDRSAWETIARFYGFSNYLRLTGFSATTTCRWKFARKRKKQNHLAVQHFFFRQYSSNDETTCPLWNLIGRKTTRQNRSRVISSCPYLPPLNAFYVTFTLRTSLDGGRGGGFSTRIYRKQVTRIKCYSSINS